MAAEKLSIAEKIDATFTIMFPQSSGERLVLRHYGT